MQRKESCLNDLKQKFLTNTCIAFYDKGSSFSDTLIKKRYFQSEFIVNFIHFVHSRVVCNYKIKNSF